MDRAGATGPVDVLTKRGFFGRAPAWAILALLLGVAGLGFDIGTAAAQSGPLDDPAGAFSSDPIGGAGGGAGGGVVGGFGDTAGDLTIHASIVHASGNSATLSITADIPAGWHTYSITQPPDGPNPTRIKLDPSDEYRLDGKFTATPPPHVRIDDAFPGVPQEEHSGQVTWKAPLVFREGVDWSRLKITGSVNAQRCSTGCLAPKDFRFTAMVAGAVPAANAPTTEAGQTLIKRSFRLAPLDRVPGRRDRPPPAVAVQPATSPSTADQVFGPPAAGEKWSIGRFQASGSDAVVQGWIEPSYAAPGSTVRLMLSIEPGPGAHVYAFANRDAAAAGSGRPTLIDLQPIPHWAFDTPRADRPPLEETSDAGPESVYDKPVAWTVNVRVPANASGSYPVEGAIGYQTCTRLACQFPKGVRFKGEIVVTPGGLPAANDVRPLSFLPASYANVAGWAAGSRSASAPAVLGAESSPPEISASSAILGRLDPRIKGTEPTNLITVILFGLLGGLILNLMPCVLPVIAIKILAFVEQGGHNRARALALNAWYSLGLLTVFMVLATLAVNLQLKWGQQFQSATFDIVLCGVVFVMALSFLGVWEIPIPGFIGSGKSAELAAQEGAVGAFAKGVFTTVLATPCSGPFLGAVFSYALTRSPAITYVVFASIGLGMASPYLLIGAFPELVRFLPKPGAWMDTFKQIMGFILLGTVVYLFSLLQQSLFLPVLALLFGLWAGCWWIGRTKLTESLDKKVKAWSIGAAVAAAIGYFAFTVLVPHPQVLPWEPYSTAKLEQLLAEKRTVMVDFTANWCPNCQLNLVRALNTRHVEQIVEANRVTPMKADWSNKSVEIERTLKALHSSSIPVLAIFPADRPNEPIVLRDVISQADVVEALQEAGPSRSNLAVIDRTER